MGWSRSVFFTKPGLKGHQLTFLLIFFSGKILKSSLLLKKKKERGLSMSVCPNNNQAVANFNSFCVIGKGAHARLTEMIATKNSIGGDVSQRITRGSEWGRQRVRLFTAVPS